MESDGVPASKKRRNPDLDDEEDVVVPMSEKQLQEAHKMYLQYHRHHDSDQHKVEVPIFPMFHRVPKTGVIYATTRYVHYSHHETLHILFYILSRTHDLRFYSPSYVFIN
jgi:hypothetical protein